VSWTFRHPNIVIDETSSLSSRSTELSSRGDEVPSRLSFIVKVSMQFRLVTHKFMICRKNCTNSLKVIDFLELLHNGGGPLT
jgi:hypothetical protein